MATDIPVWRKAVLSVEEAADYGNMSHQILRGLIVLAEAGKIDFPMFKVGRVFKIPRTSFERWLEKQGTEHTQLALEAVKGMIARMNEPPILLKRRGRPRKNSTN